MSNCDPLLMWSHIDQGTFLNWFFPPDFKTDTSQNNTPFAKPEA